MNHETSPDQNSQRAELQWAAFRYIADEMSREEHEIFERRLADDQAACEAVARAVQVAEAVASLPAESFGAGVETVPARSTRGAEPDRNGRLAGSKKKWSWMAAGAAVVAAVCLAVIIGTHVARRPAVPPDGSFQAESDPRASRPADRVADDGSATTPWDIARAGDLVSLWTDAEAAVVNGLFPASEEFVATEPGSLDESGSPLVDGEFDWILAAISAEMPDEMGRLQSRPEEN